MTDCIGAKLADIVEGFIEGHLTLDDLKNGLTLAREAEDGAKALHPKEPIDWHSNPKVYVSAGQPAADYGGLDWTPLPSDGMVVLSGRFTHEGPQHRAQGLQADLAAISAAANGSKPICLGGTERCIDCRCGKDAPAGPRVIEPKGSIGLPMPLGREWHSPFAIAYDYWPQLKTGMLFRATYNDRVVVGHIEWDGKAGRYMAMPDKLFDKDGNHKGQVVRKMEG